MHVLHQAALPIVAGISLIGLVTGVALFSRDRRRRSIALTILTMVLQSPRAAVLRGRRDRTGFVDDVDTGARRLDDDGPGEIDELAADQSTNDTRSGDGRRDCDTAPATSTGRSGLRPSRARRNRARQAQTDDDHAVHSRRDRPASSRVGKTRKRRSQR